ncbi:hypothetical protein A5906_09615 [Bradyrhizobium sacchari]|uniref:Uncharacterized protein n=1 Tax=Bradyrhizobium sacchari TaxID=1399419 RepID=A0A560J4X1_9BRAD|nr:hypothetical protein [Bradyrhizobium sacchari]OPY95226.1 hypothetical protein A5906_09615 [Bradyrhizobium sacchari]TWB46930.1 hypothetical protein FBZ94_1231 [Bradyrhizobium sacchari]TWB65875.1 hypothetical protein FBZ95_1221 [Bradyrhizobium sacchari]
MHPSYRRPMKLVSEAAAGVGQRYVHLACDDNRLLDPGARWIPERSRDPKREIGPSVRSAVSDRSVYPFSALLTFRSIKSPAELLPE